jgi:small subunit ribosomal protein S17
MSEEPENVEETSSVEAPDGDASPAETASNTAGEGSAPGPAVEPQEVLAPKERRARARAAKAAKAAAKPVVSTPEERQELRVAERKRKAGLRRVERQRSRAKARTARGEAVEATAAREHQPGVQKVRQGIVVSDKADKTITVRIDTARRHRRYEKIVRTSRTLHAHDERNDANLGDTVIVREARPLSRTKRWRLVEVVQRAK